MSSSNSHFVAMYCPICGSAAVFRFDAHPVGSVFFCQNICCGHSFVLNDSDLYRGVCRLPSEVSWLRAYSDRDLSRCLVRNQMLWSKLEQFVDSSNFAEADDLQVLDIGSGPAVFSRDLARLLPPRQVQVTCVEANKNWHAVYIGWGLCAASAISELPLDFEWDLVLMTEVIEHISDPVGFLKSLREHLSISSTLFITTPMGWPNPKLTNAYDTESHIHFFTPESLDIALVTAGYFPLRHDKFPVHSPRANVQKEYFHRFVAGVFAFSDQLRKPAPSSHTARHLDTPYRQPHSIQGITRPWSLDQDTRSTEVVLSGC